MSTATVGSVTDHPDLAAELATVERHVAGAEGTSPVEMSYAARRAVRRITSGVTVLTLNRSGVCHGTTVSAVLAISRVPLIVGACLRAPSATTGMLDAGTLFAVNVLGAGQSGVAARFADPTRRPGPAQFAALRCTVDHISGAPLLAGCVAHLSARVLDRQVVGDHDLVLAEVLGGATYAGTPLLSYAGRLHCVTTGNPGEQQ